MKKPQMSDKEIIVEVMVSSNNLFYIWCYTEKACDWLERVAPLYGKLFTPTSYSEQYQLFLHPEVVNWEEVYNLINDYTSKTWLDGVIKDYNQAYNERFPGTPYNMRRTEEDEKATRSTEYWQKRYQENKQK